MFCLALNQENFLVEEKANPPAMVSFVHVNAPTGTYQRGALGNPSQTEKGAVPVDRGLSREHDIELPLAREESCSAKVEDGRWPL